MIEISKSPNADSRSANGPLTIQQLTEDTKKHQKDVQSGMKFIADELNNRALDHDKTKLSMMEEFYAALNSGKIKQTPWYQKHITEERHHLKSHVPEDVNLIDVIEHVVDCTMAGLARSGEIFDTDLSPDVLVLAVKNTVELLKKNIVVRNNIDDIMKQPISDETTAM